MGVGTGAGDSLLHEPLTRKKPTAIVPSKLIGEQLTKGEKMLNITGDVCGGRGGELGRRLEAWLSTNGNATESDASGGETDGEGEGGGNGSGSVKAIRPPRPKRWLSIVDDVSA